MVKFTEIESEIVTALTALDDFDGPEEQREAVEAALVPYLAELGEQEAAKVDALAAASRRLDAEIEYLGNECERLAARKRTLMNNKANLRGYVLRAMQEHGIKKIKGREASLWIRTDKSVVLDVPEQELPEPYREVRVEYRADKREIKRVIESGVEIPGARLVENQTVQFR